MRCLATAVCGLVAGVMLVVAQTGALDPVLLAAGAQEAPSAPQKWRPQFPRPGATKILETDDVLVWDDVMSTYDHWHQHIYGGILFFVQNGPWTGTVCRGDGCETMENSFHVLEGNVATHDLRPLPPGASREPVGGVPTPHPLMTLGHHHWVRAGLGPHNEATMAYAAPRRVLFIEVKKSLAPDAAEWSLDPTGEADRNWPVLAVPEPGMLPTINATQKKWPSLSDAMMAAGAKKTIDNEYLTAWDETLTRTRPILHKNVRNVIAVDLWDAPVKLYNGEDGRAADIPAGYDQDRWYKRRMPSVYSLAAGTGPYDEVAAEPETETPRRTVWIEFKGTEAPDCRTWSASCN